MRSVPILVEAGTAKGPLLVEHLAEISGMGGLIHDLGLAAGLRPVLVGWAGHFMPWAGDVSEAMVIRHVDHRERCHGGGQTEM